MSELYRLYDLEDKTYLDEHGLCVWLELTHYSGNMAKLTEHPNIVVEKGFSIEKNGKTVNIFSGDIIETIFNGLAIIQWSEKTMSFHIDNFSSIEAEFRWSPLDMNLLINIFSKVYGNIHSHAEDPRVKKEDKNRSSARERSLFQKGLYYKYIITKRDNSPLSPGRRFVLNIDSRDPNYKKASRAAYKRFAQEISWTNYYLSQNMQEELER